MAKPSSSAIQNNGRETLAQRLAKLEGEIENHRASRRAALNLMEDALLAQRKAEEANERLKREIAERERVTAALRESEAHIHILLDGVGDYAIIMLDREGTISGWNKGAEKSFGFSKNEAIGQNAEIIFTPEDRERGAPEKEIQTAAAKGRAEDERFHIRNDGTRFYVSGVLMRIDFGGSYGFVKIARDMTERIAAERDLREKEMLQTLVRAQEQERKRLARDLHDELGQQLTALRLKLDAMANANPDRISGMIAEARTMARNIDNGVDLLAWDLRPAALDDLGLVPALDRFLNQWSRQSGIAALLLGADSADVRLSPEVETNLYRIVQECLNNVHKHSGAEKVEVLLRRRDGTLMLVVADDGRGFEPEKADAQGKGLGLVGMRERALLVNGELDVESSPGSGTTVYVRVPYVPEARATNG